MTAFEAVADKRLKCCHGAFLAVAGFVFCSQTHYHCPAKNQNHPPLRLLVESLSPSIGSAGLKLSAYL
jgi:hypothetical protein